LTRHKTENQPQQVSVYSASTEEMQNIGTNQVNELIAIKNGINKLVVLLTAKGGSSPVGTSPAGKKGSTETKFAANSRRAKEWGEAPFSTANDSGMQGVVSQVGMS
jgi:hypothetical protein